MVKLAVLLAWVAAVGVLIGSCTASVAPGAVVVSRLEPVLLVAFLFTYGIGLRLLLSIAARTFRRRVAAARMAGVTRTDRATRMAGVGPAGRNHDGS